MHRTRQTHTDRPVGRGRQGTEVLDRRRGQAVQQGENALALRRLGKGRSRRLGGDQFHRLATRVSVLGGQEIGMKRPFDLGPDSPGDAPFFRELWEPPLRLLAVIL